MLKFMRLVIYLTITFSIAACSTIYYAITSIPSKPPRSYPYKQRFFDLEKNQPVEGVFVYVVWRADQRCVRSALLRSGPTGWVKQSAPKKKQASMPSIAILAPEYLKLNYFERASTTTPYDKYGIEITSQIASSSLLGPNESNWIKALKERGFRRRGDWFMKDMTLPKSTEGPSLVTYLISRKGLPLDVGLVASDMGRVSAQYGQECGPSEGEKIGIELSAEVRELQSRVSVRIVCDPHRDLTRTLSEVTVKMAIASLRLDDEMSARDMIRREIP